MHRCTSLTAWYISLVQGWTEHVYEWALSDPGRMQNAQKGLQDMQKVIM